MWFNILKDTDSATKWATEYVLNNNPSLYRRIIKKIKTLTDENTEALEQYIYSQSWVEIVSEKIAMWLPDELMHEKTFMTYLLGNNNALVDVDWDEVVKPFADDILEAQVEWFEEHDPDEDGGLTA